MKVFARFERRRGPDRLIRAMICCLAGMACSLANGHAQEPPPAGPLVKTMPALSRWNVAFQYARKDPRQTAPVVLGQPIARLDVTKSDKLMRLVSSNAAGASIEVWAQGTLQVLKDPGYEHKIVRRSGSQQGDFPELAWVALSNFKGREMVDQKKCLVFTSEFYPLQFGDPGLYMAGQENPGLSIFLGDKVPVTAYIDEATRFPVKLVVGSDVRVYTLEEPPTSPLEIPPDFQAALTDVQQRYNALVKPLSPP